MARNWIRGIRIELGLSQSYIDKEACLTAGRFSRIEHGYADFNEEEGVRLATVLKIPKHRLYLEEVTYRASLGRETEDIQKHLSSPEATLRQNGSAANGVAYTGRGLTRSREAVTISEQSASAPILPQVEPLSPLTPNATQPMSLMTQTPVYTLSDPKQFREMPNEAVLKQQEPVMRDSLNYTRKILHTSGVPAEVWRAWRAFEKQLMERLRTT